MGLLRGMARTAVVAGTATAVSNRVSRRQAGRWAAQDREEAARYEGTPPYDAAPVQQQPAQDTDLIGQLERLGQLRAAGVLTQDEFDTQKARLLGG